MEGSIGYGENIKEGRDKFSFKCRSLSGKFFREGDLGDELWKMTSCWFGDKERRSDILG